MNKSQFLFPLLLIFAALFTGCESGTKKSLNINPDPGHNSRNSLDWAGTYTGVLPCASCPGIEQEIKLNYAETYQMYSRYQGADSTVYLESGTFTWDEQGQNIILDSESNQGRDLSFKVGENRIFMLNEDREMITGELADHYILNKVFPDNSITEKYWKLTELNGREIVFSEGQRREIHLIFKEKDNHVSGSAGCNLINGTYTLMNNNGIRFSKMASTMMACADMENEREFLDLLNTADTFTITEEELLLEGNDGENAARFISVYLY